jgi:DNA transformation protein
MTPKLSQLLNIGRQTEKWLNEAGIFTEEELRQVGAVEAWTRIKVARPRQVSLNALYAIYGALEGYEWDKIPEAIKEELRAEAEL